MSTKGCIRVSSHDQNEERQLIALHEVGVRDAGIYIDKQSGMDLMGMFLSGIVLQVLKAQKDAPSCIISIAFIACSIHHF